ncbi:DNA replication and repair protein RecF [Yeosuana sp. MJ-SS3]|uniref:DNA replication and repair protein RecF n=1 Tax=Gilvirhabdus luticola TaxID=3079858 RepID=A0ABU3U825_9FLAO|nr:DNA replication and repair protein RecF [Yeosuana sp. MJ-SS3]MDU8886563.1 DNA replication and repair protein RecF [Yeosuana sp. MJ-SS3]
MILKSLSLLNYKNFDSKTFVFNNKINCIVGNNGIGKTNVLDAIYHLSFGKSYFNPVATQNIKHDEDFFVINGNYIKDDNEEKIVVSLKRGQKKIIKRNAKIYEKFSDHIGFLPLVIISPADRDLITEGSDIRRKFVDNVISQSNKNYLTALINYNKVLMQRNALLKYFALNHTFNKDTLEVYNNQLSDYGTKIFTERKAFLDKFIPIFKTRYLAISNGNEEVNLIYKSDLFEDSLNILLQNSLYKDKALQYTSVGIHKDDLVFNIEDYPIKKFGSQGQQKSFLIALKLAQFDFLKAQSGVNPILLLDDIFDKLDENRVAQIIKLVDDENFGQLFISDTHAERTEQVVKQVHQSYEIFKL